MKQNHNAAISAAQNSLKVEVAKSAQLAYENAMLREQLEKAGAALNLVADKAGQAELAVTGAASLVKEYRNRGQIIRDLKGKNEVLRIQRDNTAAALYDAHNTIRRLMWGSGFLAVSALFYWAVSVFIVAP